MKMKSEIGNSKGENSAFEGLLLVPKFLFQQEADLASLAPIMFPIFWIMRQNKITPGRHCGPITQMLQAA